MIYIPAFYLAFYLVYILTFHEEFYLGFDLKHILIYIYILAFYLAFYLIYILIFYLAFYLGIFGIDARICDPAGNIGYGWLCLRSGRDHWAWMVVNEVRQGILGVDGRE